MDRIEYIARLLCRIDGYDENADDHGRPMWMNYRDNARLVIEAVEQFERDGDDGH